MNAALIAKRLHFTAATFAIAALAVFAAAKPLPALPDALPMAAPLTESCPTDPVSESVRRVWRDQLPGLIVVRRARPT